MAQWYWKEDVHPQADQFNSIHEALVDRLRVIGQQKHIRHLHLGGLLGCQEDLGNLEYLIDVAAQAGIDSSLLDMRDIGLTEAGSFVDEQDRQIDAIFKLYPWEWMVNEPFSGALAKSKTLWLEPAWKQVLSNKAFFAMLWECYPGHPNLLQTHFDAAALAGKAHVKKPFLSREGANVHIVDEQGHELLNVDGPYGTEGFVYQELAPVASFPAPETTSWHGPRDAMHAVLGAWVVEDEPVGLAVREDISAITKNSAYFVPHYFR